MRRDQDLQEKLWEIILSGGVNRADQVLKEVALYLTERIELSPQGNRARHSINLRTGALWELAQWRELP